MALSYFSQSWAQRYEGYAHIMDYVVSFEKGDQLSTSHAKSSRRLYPLPDRLGGSQELGPPTNSASRRLIDSGKDDPGKSSVYDVPFNI